MSVIIENPETNELRTLDSDETGIYPNFKLPWRMKQTIPSPERIAAHNATKEKFARMAADFGLPASMFSFVGGWLLGCPFCVAAGEVVKLYEDGKISAEQHKKLFMMAANAKDQDDKEALARLKGQLEALRASR